MNKQQALELAIKKVKEEVDLYNRIYPDLNLRMPTVAVRDMGMKGGYASFRHDGNHLIELNEKLIIEFTEEFLKRTPGHEVAHLVAFTKYGLRLGRGHGIMWQKVMLAAGKDPKRTHDYDVAAVNPELAVYSCDCGAPHHIGKMLYCRIEIMKEPRRCNKCKSALVLVRAPKGPLPSMESIEGQTVTYHCGCRQYDISKRRSNNIQLRGMIYNCNSCKKPLVKGPRPVGLKASV